MKLQILFFSLISVIPGFVHADGGRYISIAADHSNLLYSAGEQVKVVFSEQIYPSDPDLSVEVHVSFPGIPSDTVVSLENGPAPFITPILKAGTYQFQAEVHWVNIKRICEDQMMLRRIDREITFWQADIAQADEPDRVWNDQKEIERLEGQKSEVNEDIIREDSVVETNVLLIDVAADEKR